MKRLSAKERLSIALYGHPQGELPTDDYGMFILDAAILMAGSIIGFSQFIRGVGYDEYEMKVLIPQSNAQYYSDRAEKAIVDYVCSVKEFRGITKRVKFLRWLEKMEIEFERNVEKWSPDLNEKSRELIDRYIKMGTSSKE